MKKYLAAAAAAATLYSVSVLDSVSAFAAPPGVPAFNWTGLYLGGNFGYGVARDQSLSLLNDPRQLSRPLVSTYNLDPRGVLGGGEIGFNWQANPNWVFGVEADIQASAQGSTICVSGCGANTERMQAAEKLPWFGTLRGRLGWANGPALYYLTGGWAYGEVSTDHAFQITNAIDTRNNINHSLSGWTLGGGIETQLAGNWTAKIEYLYVDLGTAANSFAYTSFPAATYTQSSAIRNHVMRIGLNYKFGDPSPSSARFGETVRAPTAFNWTGLYAGGNLGYGIARDPSQHTVGLGTEFFDVSPRGAAGGGGVGYNWQAASNWVWGAEADMQASAERDSITCVANCFPQAPGFTELRVSQKLPWFGTLRGRLGWTNGPALYYLTSGWAFGEATTGYTFRCCVVGGNIDTNSVNHTLSGWTVGGGIETALAGNWTAKVEYLYVDLGSFAQTFTYSAFPTSYTESSAIRNHLARVGLNYKFGSQ